MPVDSILGQLDATGRTVTSIVLALVGVAAALALLTAWYWRKTDPHKRIDTPPNPPAVRRKAPAPDPSDDPRPGASTGNATSSPAPATVSGDQTTVLERSAVLGDDLPAETPPAPDTHGLADEVATDDIIDLRQPSGDEEADHGELTFDEWLELAEEDS
jgi:hypothetical protein